MSDIFLSYKHAQRQEARQLAATLAGRGWTVWWDWNIPSGANWQAELDAQLLAAGCVLVLWSAESVQSEWVQYEARFGLREGKLIQARLDMVQPSAEFALLQAVDLAGWDYAQPFHAGFDKLRAAIRDMLLRRSPPAVRLYDQWVDTPSEAGDLLSRATQPAAGTSLHHSRPSPVMLLPPPLPDLLDRADERAAIQSTLHKRSGVSLAGESGSGKSALLYHLGHLDHTERFHDGVVYLQGAALGEGDLAQAVHEAFFDIAPGSRPSTVEVRRHLADKTALLMIDDAALSPPALDTLGAIAPNSAWVFASELLSASANRRPIALKGLPTDDAIRLFERALWRPLTSDEHPTVARIVEAVQGHPARIEQAAGVAATQGIQAALATIGKLPHSAEQDERSRRVLAALACCGAVPLEAEMCAVLAQVDNVNEVLARLMKCGLVQSEPPGFRLTAGLAASIEAIPEYQHCRERATEVYRQFAVHERGTPRRVARLAAAMAAQMAWAAEHGRSDEALELARSIDSPLAGANRWDAWHDMLSQAHDIASRSGNLVAAGWAQHQLGTRALMLGDKTKARYHLGKARSLRRGSGDGAGLDASNANFSYLRWSRLAVLLATLGGAGLATLGAIPAVQYLLRPVPLVTPSSVDFMTQDVRAAPSERVIEIGNSGRGALHVVDARLEGSNAKSFTLSSTCNDVKVRPNTTCRLVVQFKPESTGPQSASVTISAHDVKAALSVSLRGVGTAAPVARLSAASIDFGQVELGKNANRSVTLSNTGSAPLAVAATAIEGDNTFNIVRDGCKGKNLPSDATCAVDLRFTPREPGTVRARLKLSDNADGSPRWVALAGTGHATPRINLDPASVNFGSQEVGTQSAARRLRVRNSGNIEVEVKGAALQGSAAFRIQNNCANTKLAVGAACDVEVQFAPTAIEASTGRVAIANSVGGPLIADLSGNGFGQPRIEVGPGQINFGVLKPGSPSRRERVSIASTGSDSLILQAPQIDGDKRFAILGNNCPGKLAPKARCEIEIGATATGPDKLAARLVLPHNAGGPSYVALTAVIDVPVLPLGILDFSATPSLLKQAGEVRLCFRAPNAENAEITPGAIQPTTPTGGCVLRRVAATTTFRLTVKRTGASDQRREVTVQVEPTVPTAAPAILRFEARPRQLTQPGATQLCFEAQNADAAEITPGGPQPASPNSGCVQRRVSATTAFSLTVRRAGAANLTRSVQVEVTQNEKPLPLEIQGFSATPQVLKQAGDVQLCFKASNAESAEIVPGTPQPATPTGTCVVRRVATTTTFRLTVKRMGASDQRRELSVQVEPALPPASPEILRFDANPRQLMQRGTTQLCFEGRNADAANITPGEPQPTSPRGGCVQRDVAGTTTFTLTLKRAGAANQTRSLAVDVRPRIEQAEVVGWCCKQGSCCKQGQLSRATASSCQPKPPARWFASESQAQKACEVSVP